MITKVEDTRFIQKCVCDNLYTHLHSALNIVGNFIALPICGNCGSLEMLYNNNEDNAHSILVSKVFAKVATQG